MSRRVGWMAMLAAVLAAPVAVPAVGQAVRTPGPQPDGSVILPTQWSLRPAGKQIEVGDFPVSIAMHPNGRHAAVLHCGHGLHEVIVIDVEAGTIVSRTNVDEAFYGIAFDAEGRLLYVSGSSGETVRRFRFDSGALVPDAVLPLRPASARGVPAGIAVSSDGGLLYVANLWGHSVSRVDLRRMGAPDAVKDLGLGIRPPRQREPQVPVAGAASTDDPAITKRAEQMLEHVDPAQPYPYACVLDEPRQRLYVSLWAQAAVAVIDTQAWKEVARWRVEEHPNEMLLAADGRRLFVANANRNSVSVIDPDTGTTAESLVATLSPDDATGADTLPGNTPNSLALAADGRRLFVANANINALTVFDVSEPGRSRSLGFIPVGWYPTSVRLSADGDSLVVANGKGRISDSNRNGPRPGFDPDTPTPDYIGRLFQGTVGFIDLPHGEEAFDRRMADWTAQAFSCRPAAPVFDNAAAWEGHPVPRDREGTSPISHVIYIVKENRTYDQILGDLPEGRGDPTLCLFPERITPNHHALAREFVLLDN
ncbi:MAG: bifunctional YncE family protein/alkaline phosphatase family protein, partial [Pirellulales bacterium]